MNKHIEGILPLLSKSNMPLTILCLIVGATLWFGEIKAESEKNREDIKEMEETAEKILDRLLNLDERLARIEGKLDIFLNNGD